MDSANRQLVALTSKRACGRAEGRAASTRRTCRRVAGSQAGRRFRPSPRALASSRRPRRVFPAPRAARARKRVSASYSASSTVAILCRAAFGMARGQQQGDQQVGAGRDQHPARPSPELARVRKDQGCAREYLVHAQVSDDGDRLASHDAGFARVESAHQPGGGPCRGSGEGIDHQHRILFRVDFGAPAM